MKLTTKTPEYVFPVRMYVLTLPDDNEFYEKWYELMPPTRKEKADRFRIDIGKKRCVAAYALLVSSLRELLSDHEQKPFSGSAPDLTVCGEISEILRKGRLVINEDENGKPYLPDIPVCFNMSHSGDRVAAALSPVPVGCDVEYKSKNARSVAQRFFADEEVTFLSTLSDEDAYCREFTGLWTLKESVVKCSGEGIRREFGDFSVTDENGERKKSVMLPGDTNVYHIRQYDSRNGYCFSVCSLSDDIEDEIRYMTF